MKVRTFKPQFVPKIIARIKITTIREKPWKVGETYSARHWSGLPYRTPQVEFGFVTCERVRPVRLWRNGNLYRSQILMTIDGCEAIAAEEGFADYAEMLAWFRKNHAKTFRKVGYVEGHVMNFSFSVNPP